MLEDRCTAFQTVPRMLASESFSDFGTGLREPGLGGTMDVLVTVRTFLSYRPMFRGE